MLQIAQQVKVLAPFATDFPDTYTIKEIVIAADEQTVYILSDSVGNDVNGGFDIIYLEVV